LFKAGLTNDAILAFEAVVQLEKEHAEAWRLLGECHAEHDQDDKAIICLEKSAECDAYNLPTLLALGACYVNELDSERALSNLKAWVGVGNVDAPKAAFASVLKSKTTCRWSIIPTLSG